MASVCGKVNRSMKRLEKKTRGDKPRYLEKLSHMNSKQYRGYKIQQNWKEYRIMHLRHISRRQFPFLGATDEFCLVLVVLN